MQIGCACADKQETHVFTRACTHSYDYLVLQATDNAIGFYEKMGFMRVGAISKPDEEAVAAQHAEAQRQVISLALPFSL